METNIAVMCKRLQVICINRGTLGEMFLRVCRSRARWTRNFFF